MIGETVSVKVEVKKFDGNRVELEMLAYDEVGIVGKGTHVRAVVNKNSLIKRAEKREERLSSLDF